MGSVPDTSFTVRTVHMVYLINCIMITDINQNNFFVGYDQFQCNTLF
jgi:hypothetical protein